MRALGGLLLVLVLAPALAATHASAAERLLAGVGRADITPPTGYVLGGWTRADRHGHGVHTRLNATAMVLQRGDWKVALVAVDLFAAPGGLVKEAAERNADLGFGEDNVLVSASHTHAGPGGFANYSTLNTVAPSIETIGDPLSFARLLMPAPTDRQLYTFLVDRIALAIREAAQSAAPAAAAWGQTQLPDVTRNRSLEAHLADHGIIRARGQGRPEEDPAGAVHTVDPNVDVLRVDRLAPRRRPLGAWSSFANHGTVNPSEYELYNQDHHGAAVRVFERRVREAAGVPEGELVVNVYGNGNEGDQSAGLEERGPAKAEAVGRREAEAMFAAWQDAGTRLSADLPLDVRWTRVCFCGQQTEGGRVASEPLAGLPFLTGSEEGRGPLHDLTGIPFEDRRSLLPAGDSQGHKIGIPGAASTDSVPQAVPLMTVRVGDRLIASMPGEPTVELGRRVREAVVRAGAASGVRHAVVAGLANEFILYLTTPEEYDRQHYEGGSTLYGRLAGNLLREQLAELARRMASGEPAQPAHPFDPRNGVVADGAPYGDGAASGSVAAEPADAVSPGGEIAFSWLGGERGLDRPLDDPFVTVERHDGSGWTRVTDDLWLDVRWTVDEAGRHTATWMAPAGTAAGRHRIVVTAKRYRLVSRPFAVTP